MAAENKLDIFKASTLTFSDSILKFFFLCCHFFRNFFLETGARAAYAHYGDVLIYGEGRAKQHWFSLQVMLVAGFQIGIGKSQPNKFEGIF